MQVPLTGSTVAFRFIGLNPGMLKDLNSEEPLQKNSCIRKGCVHVHNSNTVNTSSFNPATPTLIILQINTVLNRTVIMQ